MPKHRALTMGPGIRGILSCLAILASLAQARAGEGPDVTHDIWVVSGQSNACGRGKLPGPNPDKRVRAFEPKSGQWQVAADPLPGMVTGGVGPWLFAATEVTNKTDVRLDLTLLGIGGHTIGFWHPDQYLGKGLSSQIKRSGRNAQVFLWYQGESDAGRAVDDYLRLLQDLVARVRVDAGNPKMLAVIVQLASCGGANLRSIREAQRLFVIQDHHALLIPALGRSMGDNCHLDTPGYRSLGREIARAMLKTRYGVEQVNWPGPVMDQAVLGGGGKTIFVHFAEVQQLQGVEAADFVISQADRRVSCSAAESGRTLLKLTTGATITLPAELAYGGRAPPGSSLKDESGNVAPAVVLEIQSGSPLKDTPSGAPNGAGRRPRP